ncbi:hypothetical protein BDN72DRAFT_851710 [Pluteus cervinus]|uniref:Uncharacterized protein n=1 Tax=Pluteus cervinus TaxID=181527 RepID=A0ACD2ZZH6_9AGAR|nr:hypothetical protein BDN72DRAFT_851710 [Pluteus cervinus]
MDFSGPSTIQTQNAVFNNTINHFPASSERASGTKHKSPRDAQVRENLAKHAVKSASFDAAERGDPPKCHPDTRIAVQDSLVAWRSNRTAGPVRLISGWAGTGKTTIAHTMAEYWAKRGQLAGSFFFSRSSEERSSDTTMRTRDELIGALASISPSLPQPVVIVIDGLDECSGSRDQVALLSKIFSSLDGLGSSIKFLISCRPERHLEDTFNEFAPQLGPSYRIHLGQSVEDNDDIRTFFRVSLDRICHHRRQDRAMSITDGPWPSQEEVEELVDRASGQFVFAATAIRFVDDENEDPVEMLNLVLEHRTSSFAAIDQLYIVILDRSDKSNLILHVNHEPSSSLAIANFWFEKEVAINILVKHLQALLVRNPTTPGQDSEDLIQFRHKSFHDFLARPSEPHPFSLIEMNPVSKFFLPLRTLAGKVASLPGVRTLHRSQQLGYTLLYCHDHPPVVFPFEEAARRLHQDYSQHRPTFRGCICLPQLEPMISNFDMNGVQTFKSCGQDDCVINPHLIALCRMMDIPPIGPFIGEWNRRSRLRTFSFPILVLLLWLRVMLYGLLSDPSSAAYGTIRALMTRPSRLSWQARCVAIVNGILCIAFLVNTQWGVVLLLHASHIVATLALHRLLRLDVLRVEPQNSSHT